MRIVSGVNKFPRFGARQCLSPSQRVPDPGFSSRMTDRAMDSTSLFFLLRHIGDLKYMSAGQWLSIAGSGITAFGLSLAADPHHFEVAAGAAIGTIAVAIVHILQPSPIQKSKEPK